MIRYTLVVLVTVANSWLVVSSYVLILLYDYSHTLLVQRSKTAYGLKILKYTI